LLDHPQFSYLLLNFLEDERATKLIYKKSPSEETDAVYDNLIDALREKCARVVQMAEESKTTVLTDTSSDVDSPVPSSTGPHE